jgi:hypothetical protein
MARGCGGGDKSVDRQQVFGIMPLSTSCSTSERMKPQCAPHRALQSLVEPGPPNIRHTRNPEGDQISDG